MTYLAANYFQFIILFQNANDQYYMYINFQY